MTLRSRGLAAALLLALAPGGAFGQARPSAAPTPTPEPVVPFTGVRLTEESWEIPTYPLGPAEANPSFATGLAGRGPAYPYPLFDTLSSTKEPRRWKALVLENRYLSIAVLPELGGRIFAGLDKTNGYDFLYRQHVIKPARLGRTGASLSGGLEWNAFDEAGARPLQPVDYTVEEHANGSKTLWMGEIELRHRMKWLVGITLYPERSYVEQTVKLFNRTPLAQSFAFWSSAAVPAGERYQVFFPPRTDWASTPGQKSFVEWNADLGLWKSHPDPGALFGVSPRGGFLAGYDQGKKAGLVQVADPQVVPGKKFGTWGSGPAGRAWDKVLTDADGPSAELAAGAFADSQPEKDWLQPGESKVFKQYWYPLRAIGGAKGANRDAAVNLEVVRGKVRLGFVVTAEHPQSRAFLWAGQRALVSEPLPDLGPGRPYAVEVALPGGAREDALRAVLVDEAGRELISYAPAPREPDPRPPAPPALRPPSDIPILEDLVLAGSRLEAQGAAPDAYYQEALGRDPGDLRSNTALGLLYLKRGRAGEAERFLRAAVSRAAASFAPARSTEALYYLGVALQAQGRLDEAAPVFARAAWDRAFEAPASLGLARIAAARNDFATALEAADRSLGTNPADPKALGLRAAILRHRGRSSDAEETAARALAVDPLDFLAANEQVLALAGRGGAAGAAAQALRARMRDQVPSYLELAMDYAGAGLFEDADTVVSRLVPANEQTPASPLLLYARAAFRERRGDAAGAARDTARAARQPVAYVFPWQHEMAGVLDRAMSRDPTDARAPFYLGNLIYASEPDRALALWEKARALDPTLPAVHRNLAFGLGRRPGGFSAAVASQEKAVELAPNDPSLLLELDELYEKARVAGDARLSNLEAHADTARRSDRTLARWARLLLQAGRDEAALEMLRAHHFHEVPGEPGVYGVYTEALLRRGRRALGAGQAAAARVDFQAARTRPDNMEAGSSAADDEPRVLYHLGLAQKAMGLKKEARATFLQVAAARAEGETGYYRGLALVELGRKSEAGPLFDALVEEGRRRRDEGEGRYLLALGLLGRGDKEGAAEELRRAITLDPNHLGALGILTAAR